MKKNDDFYNVEGENDDLNIVLVAVLASLIVIAVIVTGVVFFNRDKIKNNKNDEITVANNISNTSPKEGYVNLDDYISGSDRISDDLNIWDEFLDDKEEIKDTVSNIPDDYSEEEPQPKEETIDNTKTKVIKKDGSELYVNINQYLAKNELDNASFVLKNGRLSYYKDGEKVSYTGIIIDKNDDFVDFNKVKKDGIDFALIRLGQRGYGTGEITIDDNYYNNIKNARDAGLKVGVLFSSQAITVDEATEEAQFVIDTLGEEKIDYPVCFYMNYIDNDKSRIDGISSNQKSIIADTFCQKIKDAGMCSIVYGSKEWLLCDLNYTAVAGRDILLSQKEDIPDFPYRINMWEYAEDDVSGITGKSELIISFVDYSIK